MVLNEITTAGTRSAKASKALDTMRARIVTRRGPWRVKPTRRALKRRTTRAPPRSKRPRPRCLTRRGPWRVTWRAAAERRTAQPLTPQDCGGYPMTHCSRSIDPGR